MTHLSHPYEPKEPNMPPATKAPVARRLKRAKAIVINEPTPQSATTARFSIMMEDFLNVYNFPPQQRIELIRSGVPAKDVGRLAKSMRVPKEILISSLGIARATLSRKERQAL